MYWALFVDLFIIRIYEFKLNKRKFIQQDTHMFMVVVPSKVTC